jgi:hypothetical protein
MESLDLPGHMIGGRTQLKPWFCVFLKKISDVDREPLQFFIQRLSRAKTESLTCTGDIAIVSLQRLCDYSSFVILEELVETFCGRFTDSARKDSTTDMFRKNVAVFIGV